MNTELLLLHALFEMGTVTDVQAQVDKNQSVWGFSDDWQPERADRPTD
ncbi:hypothetical protein [Streptococcus halichoeri]|nr:hypothetical protein [Streptococcus halichoeri]